MIRQALGAVNPLVASASSKGAAVLAAAALERYLNDVITEAAKRLAAARWEDLTEGQQQYLALQMAGALYVSSRPIYRKNDLVNRRRQRLRKAVNRCQQAFGSPAAWPLIRQYGMFVRGSAEAPRIDGMLKRFDPAGRGFLEFCEQRGRDKATLVSGLTSLIEARHRAAHALGGTTWPGTTDVRAWVRTSIVVARQIDAFLGL